MLACLVMGMGMTAVGAVSGQALAQPAVAITENGPANGVVRSNEITFLGLAYAQPPVGALRWQPPQPIPPGSQTIDATKFAPHCAQPASPFGVASASEDCLYLNVYTPISPRGVETAGAGYPVMVWFHGGGLLYGESEDFDPVRLVQRGVIVVTVNYRLGAFGFLAHPALDGEGHSFANYGLMDQQAALGWVKRNIAGFGANPENITIFGQSAGGESVTAHLVSPIASKLFEKAIIQSGNYAPNLPTLATAEAQGQSFATSVGCDDQSAACLRNVPVSAILANQAKIYTVIHEVRIIVPSLDGTVLTSSPDAAFQSGQFNRVPVMAGSNHDEGRLFTALLFDLRGGPLTAEQYPQFVALAYGAAAAPSILAEYPLTNYPSPDLAFAALLGDSSLSCTALFADRQLSRFVPVYGYEFNDPDAPMYFLPPVSFPYLATHTTELAFLFDLVQAQGKPGPTADEEALSRWMARYWTRFAQSGSPQGNWPAFNATVSNVQELVPPRPTTTAGFSADHHCDFWEQLANSGQTAASMQ